MGVRLRSSKARFMMVGESHDTHIHMHTPYCTSHYQLREFSSAPAPTSHRTSSKWPFLAATHRVERLELWRKEVRRRRANEQRHGHELHRGRARVLLVNAGRIGQQALLNNGNVSKKSSVMNAHVRAHAPQIFSKCSIGVRVLVAVSNGDLQCGRTVVTALRCEGWCVSHGCNKMRARCKSHVCERRSLCASPF
jgi:hypothetical protein